MAKVPAFWFYPSDWLRDLALCRCSLAARGVWMDMLCLMFDSETRGTLETAGTAWTDHEIAQAVHGDRTEVLAGITELLEKGVAHRNEAGAIYSRRMLRDEAVRLERSKAGKMGGRPRKQNESKPKANTKPNPKQIPDNDNDNDKREERNSLRDWIADRWFPSGVTESNAAEIDAAIEDLQVKSGTVAQCGTVCAGFAAKWPNATLTLRAMLKHWDTFLHEPAGERTVTPGLNRAENERLKHELRQQTVAAWYGKLDELTRARLWEETRAGMVAKAVTEDILAGCDTNEDDRAAWMYHHECLRLGRGPEYERAAK